VVTAIVTSAYNAKIRGLLDEVYDPELPGLTIADLGVLRGVSTDNGQVAITLTPTYSGCPATQVIEMQVRDVLLRAGLQDFRIDTELAPAWSSEWITERGRAKLRELGIAPPVGRRGDASDYCDPEVECPRCGASNTEKISEFGSTACKAHYRCRACLEPFDYFKCI
jgi:ring-1,2-phenylacetyl-CoA epoxidase subunit PaaD